MFMMGSSECEAMERFDVNYYRKFVEKLHT